MAQLTPDSVKPWIADRIVSFFNQAQSITEITKTVQDDPKDGPGNAIGRTVARRILAARDQKRWRRFGKLEEIYEVEGMGPDKLEDLVYTFDKSAAQAFRDAMYSNHVISELNWPLEFFQAHIESTEEFEAMAHDEEKFRLEVVHIIERIMESGRLTEEQYVQMTTGVSKAYIDPYNNTSTDYPAYELAQWFYGIDMGNFFFFESGIPQTQAYFSYHPGSPWEMELRMFKGVRSLIIPGGLVPSDLATVVNYPEQVITLWTTALFD